MRRRARLATLEREQKDENTSRSRSRAEGRRITEEKRYEPTKCLTRGVASQKAVPPLEAMALGTAAIVSTAGSLPEVCGEAAVQLAPSDAEGLAIAIDRLLSSPAERAERSARGPEVGGRLHVGTGGEADDRGVPLGLVTARKTPAGWSSRAWRYSPSTSRRMAGRAARPGHPLPHRGA